MYKIGDKFEIEIDDTIMTNKGMLYQIKGFNALVFDDYGLNKLKKIDEDEKFSVGDEVLIAPNNRRGVILECNVPDICGEEKCAVFTLTEVVYCIRAWLKKTGKQYDSFAAAVREIRDAEEDVY